ncbi:alpha/beta hydrolase [Acidobacteriota bacterium]
MNGRNSKYVQSKWIFLIVSIIVLACVRPAIGEVKTVDFFSESVGRTMKFNIYLPKDYHSTKKSYPVLYLLHGLTSNYKAWAFLGAPKYASEYDLIVVMPDGGNSWYVNWAKSEGGQKNNWEDSIIKDLIPHVDGTYRTINRREGRAINGLSMGGYGAIMLGLKHPELFCSIGSHSGVIGYARSHKERLKKEEKPWVMWEERMSDKPDPLIGIEGFSSQAERSPKGQIFLTEEDCDAYDSFKLILQIPKEDLPHIYIDCGIEDGLIRGARNFIRVLEDNNIPFVNGQSKGGHTSDYWSREVGLSMAVQYLIIQRQLAKKN